MKYARLVTDDADIARNKEVLPMVYYNKNKKKLTRYEKSHIFLSATGSGTVVINLDNENGNKLLLQSEDGLMLYLYSNSTLNKTIDNILYYAYHSSDFDIFVYTTIDISDKEINDTFNAYFYVYDEDSSTMGCDEIEYSFTIIHKYAKSNDTPLIENINFISKDRQILKTNEIVETISFADDSSRQNITFFKIPDSVTSIGNYAFHDCPSLTGITLGNSVTTIGKNAFNNCSKLTRITIPDSVTTIGDYAFYICSKLTSVTLGNSVTTIGTCAFENCYSLTAITIPDSVTSIGDYVFYYCTSLTGITIPDSVTTIGKNAFQYCTSLTGITIPDSVTDIGNSAFSDCSKLTSVTLGNSVTTIGDYTFNRCTSLTGITIPDSVTSIGEHAFYGCYIEKKYFINNSSASGYPWGATLFYSEYTEGQTILTLSEGKYGFDVYGTLNSASCSSLLSATNVIVGTGVTAIGISAFTNDTKLKTIDIGDTVTVIDDSAFYSNTNLTNVSLKEGLTTIGVNVFSDCTSLTGITIPDSVTSIGYYVFKNVPIEMYNSTYYFHCPETAVSAKVNDSIKVIFKNAFNSAASLTSVSIGNSVSGIDTNAFYNCKSLTEVTIPDSVSFIGQMAFMMCDSLESISFGSGLIKLRASVFAGCQNVTGITYNGTVEQWSAVTKTKSIMPWYGAIPSAVVVTCTNGTVPVRQ